ncbi:MAG: hypothetical protein MJ082_00595 [Clostridia bacterium]|nr:hypothetical protein [Clostridia bacterium]
MADYQNSPEIEVPKSKFGLWLENFWYHYKWHTLIILFFAIVITVCVCQCSKKDSYDVYYMYAGDYEVSMKSDNGGVPEYKTISGVLTDYASDRDGNGEIKISFLPLFYLTNAQITAENQRLKDEGKDEEVNVNLIRENADTFAANVTMSDYYICFLSPEVYEYYKQTQSVNLYAEAAPYTDGAAVEFYDAYTVKLSSLPIYQKAGIRDLPDDTLVAIRILSDVAKRTDRKSAEIYAAAEEAFRKLMK